MAHKQDAESTVTLNSDRVNELIAAVNAFGDENRRLKREVLEERITGLTAQIRLAELMRAQAEAELEALN